jgi:peptidyl-prolyl cis-trans isomerase SurA
MTRSLSLLALVAALAVAGACRSTTTAGEAPRASSPNTWAVVDGRDITRDAVEKAFRRAAASQPQRSEEEALAAKLQLLNEMILEEMLVNKARELKIEVADTEIDNAYAEAKKNISDDQFQKELSSRNLTPADMRESLRRDMLSNKVFEREVTSKIVITDDDIKAFYEANKASFNRPEDAVHIGQITVTPTRANQQINRSGNDAGSPQEAQAKAQMLMERLKAGAPFAELAADFSEDPESAQRGGDLGFVPISALRQPNVAPALRDAVLNSQPGSVRMVSIGGGHTIVLVVARDTAGQKDLSMPQVKDAITQTLRGRREQLMRAAYVAALRNDAEVVNYLADNIVAAQGKAPTLTPTAPGAK